MPCIIFAAGYNLNRRAFYKYFIYIFIYGVVGTIVNFLTVAPLTIWVNNNNWFTFSQYNSAYLKEGEAPPLILNFSTAEILLFASVISSTDAVCALSFVKEKYEPKLFSILFGEGVVNDAICIVLYQIIKKFTDKGDPFTPVTVGLMGAQMAYLFIVSLIVGVLFSMLSAWVLLKLKPCNLNRVQEISLVLLFAYLMYTFAEFVELSPIIALLFGSIFMSHYTFYNLSFQAMEESSTVSKSISAIAEGFVFTYLGLTFIYYMSLSVSYSFILIETIIVTFGRLVNILGMTFLIKLIDK